MIRALVSDLMHDRASGPAAQLAKGALWAVSQLYGVGVSFWDAGYRSKRFQIHKLGYPVISVGNLTVGGTGKTPFLRVLARQLEAKGEKVAILSRGYGAIGPGISDETLELKHSLPGVSLCVGKNRLKQAQQALATHPPTVFLLDDGFQHRRIHRDLNICLMDATNPFGNGHLLPGGILRERPSALKRADLFVLTHLEGWPSTSNLLAFLDKTAPGIPIVFARHRARGCHQVGGNSLPLEKLKTERPFVFSGLADPSSLDRTLQELGVHPIDHRRFLDHHPYTRWELETIEKQAKKLTAGSLLTTQKDLARIQSVGHSFEMPLFVLEIEMELFQNERELTNRLDTLLQR